MNQFPLTVSPLEAIGFAHQEAFCLAGQREHPDRERIDPSRPIKSWRSAWRAALKRAKLQIRFHDLRHACITKLAESQASEQTLMAIAGHVSRSMIEHYSHIRMEAKRAATDAIVERAVNQNVNQQAEGGSKPSAKSLCELNGGPGWT
jgi:integrase